MPDGPVLVELVAAAAHGGHRLERARDVLAATLGDEALVDAAAVIANFHMMTRIADGTGTPLDRGSAEMSGQLRAELGIDDMVSARSIGP